MSGVQRKLLLETRYKGHEIEVRRMGPDLLAYVDNVELPGFYIDTQAAVRGCTQYINQIIKEQQNG